MVEARFDFSGGLNTRQSPDQLQSNELVQAANARLSHRYGAIVKRTGCRQLHPNAIASGADVTGLIQWDDPDLDRKEVIAIAGGDLFWKTATYGAFTAINPTTAFSTTTPQILVTARANTSGAPLQLYIADGNLQVWDSTSVTDLTGAGAPAADLIAFYHLRLFARDANFPQSPQWSVLGDPEDFTAGLGDQGGQAMVDVLRGEGLTAMAIVGSSLLMATSDSVIRFTGYSAEDIQIAQDTEGISAEVGATGPLALKQIESFAAMFSDRGPYIVTEAQAQAVGVKVEPEFDDWDRSALGDICIGYHSGRREIWWALDQEVYVMSIGGVQAWTGPFTYDFGIKCLASYEDTNGDEYIIAGCDDGFVRVMDTGSLDDVDSSGSGGSAYTMTVELAPVFFESGPGMIKTLERIFLQAEIPEGKTIEVRTIFDDGSAEVNHVTGVGGGVQDYRIDCYDQGRRLRVQIVDDTDDICLIHGMLIQAFDMQRPG